MRESRGSRYKQDRLIEHFVGGKTARIAASLYGVNCNANLHKESFVRPVPEASGHNAPRLVAELVPCKAAMVEDIAGGFKDPV